MQQRPTNYGDVIQSVAGLLSRFAHEPAMRGVVGVIGGTGVRCQASKTREHMLKFSFRTHDDIPVAIAFDMHQLSREYIDNMVRDLGDKLLETRRKRHERILPDLGAALRSAV